jgi:transcriptional regulator with XRE-family HTH domain
LIERREMNRIKEILQSQGRSQTWLAKHVGKSYVIVTNYCNNKSQPSIQTLHKISEILSVDIRDLLDTGKKSSLKE